MITTIKQREWFMKTNRVRRTISSEHKIIDSPRQRYRAILANKKQTDGWLVISSADGHHPSIRRGIDVMTVVLHRMFFLVPQAALTVHLKNLTVGVFLSRS